MNYSANPDARGNIQAGRLAYESGLRDKVAVFRAHLAWNQGAAADHHFCAGYRAAAEAAGGRQSVGDALDYVQPHGETSLAEQTRRLEVLCEEQTKKYGHAPAQWLLDRLRGA